MLTEAEKKWLEKREQHKRNGEQFYSCADCEHRSDEYDLFDGWCDNEGACPIELGYRDLQDAAEFEARVAAKLSIREDLLTPCILDPNPETHGECKQWRFYWQNSYAVYWGCAACRLKYARLAVEAEMEKE